MDMSYVVPIVIFFVVGNYTGERFKPLSYVKNFLKGFGGKQ